MNKVFLDNKLVENVELLKGFKITINGNNNTLFLNEFSGSALVYIYVDGDNCRFSFGKNNTVNNDFGINYWRTATDRPINSVVSIGDNNIFNGSNNSIIAPLNTKIEIGNNNLFAGGITFWGRNDHIIYDNKTKKRLNNDRNILIGSNNWICQNVTFLPKGEIGDNCVVGYGSLINQKINKNNCLIAGNPAKIRRKRINWSRASNYDCIDFKNNNNIKEIKNMDFKNAIKEYYEREIECIKRFNLDELNEAMNAILNTYESGGTIYVCGNGGSASTASHMQNDFNKGISEYVEKKFIFCCLNDNVSTMMAIANDIGYEEVFRFPILNKITDKDLLIGISGSGNSKNVLNAAEYAKNCGAKVLAMTGYTGGKLKEMADYKMHVDEMDMQIAEDLHMTFDHMMMKIFYNFLTKGEITGNNINDKH